MDLSILLGACPVISILRGMRPEEAESIGIALIDSGIRIAEVPLNSPEPLKSISILSKLFGDQMLIGAGTVTAPEQVEQVASAGGQVIVSPHADIRIVRAAKNAHLIVIPGAFTPTEVFAMHEAGAEAIKLFPAEVMGREMLKALLAVLPKDTKTIAVGGIDSQNATSWIDAGASGVGIGSAIYKPGDTSSDVRNKAQRIVSSLAKRYE